LKCPSHHPLPWPLTAAPREVADNPVMMLRDRWRGVFVEMLGGGC
jgi:hypothetical protein